MINVSAKLCWRGVALASVERELKKPRTDSTSLSNLAVHVIAASAHPRKYDNAHAGQCGWFRAVALEPKWLGFVSEFTLNPIT